MSQFMSTFIFILPGIMAYFWLQVFGINPSVKHTAPELSGLAALLWLPVSFTTLLVLNIWGYFINEGPFDVNVVWTLDELNIAISDINYSFLFLMLSFIVSFLLCWAWGKWGNDILRDIINKVRKSRDVAPLSSTASVWEEFFIKINGSDKKNDSDKNNKGKEAVYLIYKLDKPEEFIIGSMTKASRPFEIDKAVVLSDVERWKDSLKYYEYEVINAYVDIKSGMVVKELDFKNPKEKTIPVDFIT